MGRSSILLISFLLSIDYGIRVCTYFQMATIVLNTTICRMAYDGPDTELWFNNLSWSDVNDYTSTVVPTIIFFIALPLALMTTVRSLKWIARGLFVLSCIVFVLVLVVLCLDENNDLSDGKYIRECVS